MDPFNQQPPIPDQTPTEPTPTQPTELGQFPQAVPPQPTQPITPNIVQQPIINNDPSVPFSDTTSTDTTSQPTNPTIAGNSFTQYAAGMPMQAPQPMMGNFKPRKSKLKLAMLAFAAVVVLGGGSAFAYFGVVVPNKPENILKAALINTLQKSTVTATGNFKANSIEDIGFNDNVSVNSVFTIKTDINAKTLDADMKFTINGVSIPFTFRFVDKNVYFKIGDISTIKSLLAGEFSDYKPFIDAVNKIIENQWIAIDETVYKGDDKLDCYLDALRTPNKAEATEIINAYKGNRFAILDKSSNEKLDGKETIKYELSVNSDALNNYGEAFAKTHYAKDLVKCYPGAISDQKGDEEVQKSTNVKVPTFVWVDKKNKVLRKISYSIDGDDGKGSVAMTMDYGLVDIKKPDTAKPVMQVIGELQALIPHDRFTDVLGDHIDLDSKTP